MSPKLADIFVASVDVVSTLCADNHQSVEADGVGSGAIAEHSPQLCEDTR
jgi:hypothetical protein